MGDIVIIDDDYLVRKLLVDTFEYGLNKRVQTFEDGFSAWRVLSKTNRADLVIADANIPELDGLELLEKFKTRYPERKFVLTSSDQNDEKRARALGADAFLLKPFNVTDIFAVLQRLLGDDLALKKNKPDQSND